MSEEEQGLGGREGRGSQFWSSSYFCSCTSIINILMYDKTLRYLVLQCMCSSAKLTHYPLVNDLWQTTRFICLLVVSEVCGYSVSCFMRKFLKCSQENTTLNWKQVLESRKRLRGNKQILSAGQVGTENSWEKREREWKREADFTSFISICFTPHIWLLDFNFLVISRTSELKS